MMKERSLPQVLGDYAQQKGARFHMPGHKGRGMGGFWHADIIEWDVTELSDTDNLHMPENAIRRVQEQWAACCGAEDAFCLVNGSTAGILAMLLSLPHGAKVLLARDCHKAAVSGAVLSGADCRFIWPGYDEEYDLWGAITPDALEQALEQEPVDAVLIGSPNYYGFCADIPALSRVAHAHGALLFVDAAHGAHFPFGNTLPDSPAGYADLWVSSAHKTLNALGQSAILFRDKSCPIPQWRIQKSLALVQTSSPSYLLMASMDWARYSAGMQGWDKHAAFCEKIAAQIQSLPGLQVLNASCVGRAGIVAHDPTRLTVDVSLRGLTGFAVAAILEEKNIFVEMADLKRVVCICTPSDDPAWYTMLVEALEKLPYRTDGHVGAAFAQRPHGVQRRLPLSEAALGKQQRIPLADACGRIAAEAAGLYPPGIALFTPGEVILQQDIDLLQHQQQQGGALFGVRHGQVMVVEE